MTEYWVSQGKHWCDLCKCWMNDTVTARANHEKGSGHKINVQRKLREMRLKEEKDKKEEARTKEELKKIDTAAERAYQKDLARQDAEAPPMPPPAHPPPQFGSWAKSDASQYWYNKELQWYYDDKSGFYYGGHPAAWTQTPSIPDGARYEKMHKEKVSSSQVVRGKLPQDLAQLGGYQAPISGNLTRGITIAGQPAASAKPEAAGAISADGKKRNREEPEGNAAPVSKEEEEERKQREAARKRVQARTAAAFGLG